MNTENIFTLAIESSCDDTSVAVLQDNRVLSNVISNQEIHRIYGGVVPELASRAHLQNIVPTIDAALKAANVQPHVLHAIAITCGPGLLGSLVVGVSFAKSLALSLGIPLIEVNHMQGHILSHFIETSGNKKPEFPFLALTISGGHTQIIRVDDFFDMTILGQTLDDAVGEAFDKTAKILGLPYPGGPVIDKLAKDGNPMAFSFTRPSVQGLDFSFSGLKTAILNFVNSSLAGDPNFVERNLCDICASVQHTIVGILIDKLKKASEQTGIYQIAVGGGVSANSGVREALHRGEQLYGWKTFVPRFEFCTDNAAMIGIAGYYKFLRNDFSNLSVVANPRLGF